jgi:AcrR family transcriptional regulator
MVSMRTTRLEGVDETRTDVRVRRRDGEVLAAATGVFYRRGYANATVQDVADALGMLKGSLYYYIKSKEELLYRITAGVHDDVDVLMRAVMERADLSPLERIEEFVRRQVEYNIRNLEAISVYHHDMHHLSKDLRREVFGRRRRVEAMVISLLEEAQQAGEIDRDMDPVILSQSIFATVIWIYRWYRPSAGISVAKLRETCVAFVTGGVGAGRAAGA